MTTPAPSRVRLIWDFFGPHAERTARHHQRHLDEFVHRECAANAQTGTDSERDTHWMAWMVVDAADVQRVRDALRPQRGLPADA